jgi:predicted kinase
VSNSSAEAFFVVVSGPPGSGKSTLATSMAARLALPLLAKDVIKEVLMLATPPSNVKESSELGAASLRVLYEVARLCPAGAILDANFYRDFALEEIERLPGKKVEVFCRCDEDVAQSRYRARSDSRHPGHFDSHRSWRQLWSARTTEPISVGWPVVEVNTTNMVNVEKVIASLGQHVPLK